MKPGLWSTRNRNVSNRFQAFSIKKMNLLFIADIVGKPGIEIVKNILPGLVKQYGADIVVANGKNAAEGFGITPAAANMLFEAGIDVITSGNHIWDKKTIIPYIKKEPRLLRPLNFPSAAVLESC